MRDDELEAAIAELWAPACRVAARLGLDAATAEDVAQEALVRLVSGDAGYDASRPLRPWLLKVVHNAALQRLRGEARRRRREEARARPEREEAPAMTGDLEELRATLATLGAEQREVIALHYDGGLTLAEVAEVLGCPRGTVDSRLHRALSRLRERMSPQTAALVPTPAFASLLQRTHSPTSPAPTLTALRALRPSVPPPAPRRGAATASALALAALAASLLGALAFGVLTDDGGSGGPSAPSVASPAPVSTVTSRSNVASAPVTTSSVAGADRPSPRAIADDAPELPPDDPAPELVHRAADPRTPAIELLFVDPDGRPVPLVRVDVREDRHEAFGVGGGGVSRRAPASDAAGRVVIEGLGPGDYIVEWDAPDGLSDGQRSLQKPGGEPRLQLTIPLERERWVEGRVVDAGGAPCPGASVQAFARRTKTDATGRFRLGPLRAVGHVTVIATTTDRRVARRVVDLAATGEVVLTIDPSVDVVGRVDEVPPDPRVARVHPEGAEDLAVEVTLGDDGAFSCSLKPGSYRLVVVSFAALPAMIVRTFVVPDDAARVDVGTLRADGPLVRARVVDERGAPLVGAVLVALLDDAGHVSQPSGPDGRVEVRVPPTAARLQVRLGHPDHVTAERTLLAQPLLDLGDVALAPAVRLRLMLRARGGAGFRSNGGRPAVWMVTRDGAVRLGTTFRLPAADDPFGLASPEYALAVETKLAPGLHRLRVIQDGYAPVDLGEVEVRDGAPPREVDLTAGGVLVVRALGPGGEPLEGAELSLDDSPDPSRVERTDALGRATFEHVAPGRRLVRSPWLQQPAEVDVREGEQTAVELRLRRP